MTTFLIVLAILLVAGLLFLLLVPLNLRVDSEKGFGQVSIGRIFRMRVEWSDEDFQFRLAVPFYRRKWTMVDLIQYSLESRNSSDRETTGEVQKREEIRKRKRKQSSSRFGRRRMRWIWKYGIKVIRSFRVRRFYINIDTDDYVLNAYLYPVFFLVGRLSGLSLQINYLNRVRVDLDVQNRLIRVIYYSIFK